MSLEEFVDVLPDFGQPFDDLVQFEVRSASRGCLRCDQATSEESTEEATDRLNVVGVEDPSKVVMQLEIRR